MTIVGSFQEKRWLKTIFHVKFISQKAQVGSKSLSGIHNIVDNGQVP